MNIGKPDNVFDQFLVLEIQSGKRKALNLLAKRWQSKLYYYAFRKTRDKELAQDVSQESWEAIIKGIHKLEDPAKFPAWALGITFRKSVDAIRNLQKERKQKEENPEPSNLSEPIESDDTNVQILRKAIRKLSKKQRQILELFYLENYSLLEISQYLNIPEGTIKSRLFNARKSLKEQLINSKSLKNHV